MSRGNDSRGVCYREGPLAAEDYDEAIESMQAAKASLADPAPVCAVCHDGGHTAEECHHNPLVLARRFVHHKEFAFWRCFHCDEVFPLSDPEAAQDHFGKAEDEVARCLAAEVPA